MFLLILFHLHQCKAHGGNTMQSKTNKILGASYINNICTPKNYVHCFTQFKENLLECAYYRQYLLCTYIWGVKLK